MVVVADSRPKLIEVALPLAVINAEAARREVDSAWASVDVASLVGSTAVGGGSGGDLGVAGGRSVGDPSLLAG